MTDEKLWMKSVHRPKNGRLGSQGLTFTTFLLAQLLSLCSVALAQVFLSPSLRVFEEFTEVQVSPFSAGSVLRLLRAHVLVRLPYPWTSSPVPMDFVTRARGSRFPYLWTHVTRARVFRHPYPWNLSTVPVVVGSLCPCIPSPEPVEFVSRTRGCGVPVPVHCLSHRDQGLENAHRSFFFLVFFSLVLSLLVACSSLAPLARPAGSPPFSFLCCSCTGFSLAPGFICSCAPLLFLFRVLALALLCSAPGFIRLGSGFFSFIAQGLATQGFASSAQGSGIILAQHLSFLAQFFFSAFRHNFRVHFEGGFGSAELKVEGQVL